MSTIKYNDPEIKQKINKARICFTPRTRYI